MKEENLKNLSKEELIKKINDLEKELKKCKRVNLFYKKLWEVIEENEKQD